MITELWCENNINQTELMSLWNEEECKKQARQTFSDFFFVACFGAILKLNIYLIHGANFHISLVDCERR